MKKDSAIPSTTFLTTVQGPLLLQKLLQEDCSRGSEGLLCQDTICPLPSEEHVLRERELAIFFLDIQNFTGLLQAGSPAETIEMVKKLLSLFISVIAGFGGKLVDRLGDNLYAVFGMETNINRAAEAAVQTANMLFEMLKHINADFFASRYGYKLKIGIGLHSGPVIIENATDDRPFSVMGLPVNIASRLQAETKNANNDLIISDALYHHLSKDIMSGIGNQQIEIYIAGIKEAQTVWLAGHPYLSLETENGLSQVLNYLLAIAG